MVRKAITIISLLLSVLMPTYASAKKIEVTEKHDYILYVKDIGLPDSVKIYGQPTFIKEDQYYGGNNMDYFKREYTNVNSSIPELTFDRDKDGIFFKIHAATNIDSIVINLVVAEDTPHNGWCPKKTSKDLPIVWRLREKQNVVENPTPVDTIPAKDVGGEAATAAPSPWHISNTDWGLFILIVLLAFVILFVNKQPQKKNEDKEKAAEDSKSEIANLKKQIANLIAANNNSTKTISDLVSRYNTLESDIQKLQKKDRHVNTDKITSESIQLIRPIHPAQSTLYGCRTPMIQTT